MPLRTHFNLDLHRWNRGHEVPHPYQIVSGAGEGEEPVDLAQSAMAQFAQQSHGLQPAKAFLDPLPLPLTQGVPRMSCRASINGTAAAPAVILGYVRHHAQGSALGDEPERVESFIATHRKPTSGSAVPLTIPASSAIQAKTRSSWIACTQTFSPEVCRCWLAPENLKIGDKFRQSIDHAIRLHDNAF